LLKNFLELEYFYTLNKKESAAGYLMATKTIGNKVKELK
jgi:hypothetical protein